MNFFSSDKIIFETRKGDFPIQVSEKGDQRILRFGNHIVQSAMSLTAPDMLLLDYTRAMALGLVFTSQINSFLHIGMGGGSLIRFFHAHFSGLSQTVVELSPEVATVARSYFQLPPSENLNVQIEDGAEFLRKATNRYDLIFLDAFDAHGAADHMTTETLFRLAGNRLAPGGWLVNNTWGSDKKHLYSVRKNLLSVYSQLYSVSVRSDSNVIYFATQSEAYFRADRMRNRALRFSEQTSLDLAGLLGKVKTDKSPSRSSENDSRVVP